MPRKIRPIEHKEAEAQSASVPYTEENNAEHLEKEIAEFDRIAEGLKSKEKERAAAMAAKASETPPESFDDDVKAEIAKHVRAREAALKAMKKAPLPPAGPVEEGPLHELRVKHVLEPVEEEDGTRLLVERIWPKNLNRKNYPMTDWQPAVGPTFALQKEFAASPEKFEEFTARYREFLEKDPSAREFKTEIRTILRVENVTFLHASEDRSRNSASVLREWVLE